jgi:DNA-binding NarL/FixJ family response regulator
MDFPFLISAMIAAPAGVMISSLRTFLHTIPGVTVVNQVDTQAAALQQLHSDPPYLLLFDADLAGGNLAAGLQALRHCAPGLNLIVLVNNPQQQQTALAAGANHALLKGFLDEQLRRAVQPDI